MLRQNQYSYYGPEGAYTDENGVEHAEGPYIKYDKYYNNAAYGAVTLNDRINTLASELGFVTVKPVHRRWRGNICYRCSD